MTKDIQIRKLTAHDVEAFWHLRLEALAFDPQAFGADYEDSKNTPIEETAKRIQPSATSFVLGAFNSDLKLVGMLGFFRRQGTKMQHKGTLWGMFTQPAFRGQGIGGNLVSEMLKQLRDNHELEDLTLAVVTTRAAARKLYTSAGFKVYGIEKNALKINGEYFDEELMTLKLQLQFLPSPRLKAPEIK